MAKSAGKLNLIKKDGVAIGGGKNTGFSVNGSPIDVQDQGDDGFQTLLDGVVTGQSIGLSLEGYEEDQVLRDLALGPASGRFLDDITFEAANGDEISGSFFLSVYEETGEFEDGTTFKAAFTSNGPWTFTEGT